MKRNACKAAWILAPLVLLGAMAAMTARAEELQSLDSLGHAAESLLTDRLQSTDGGAVAHVTASSVDSRLRLQRCTQPLQAVIPATLRATARMTVGVRCAQPNWTVYVPVAVETDLKVLVLKRAVVRNSALDAADVELQSRRVPGVAAGYLTDVKQLTRRHLRMGAAPGTALTVDLLADDILIKRGQRVTLVAAVGGLEVRAQGEAMADASGAGRVRVLNLSSRKIVEGLVESADQVRIGL